MATDKSGASGGSPGRESQRRPLVIDLPAEEIGRKPAEAESAVAADAAASGDGFVVPESAGAAAAPAEPDGSDAPPAGDQPTPSAFATGEDDRGDAEPAPTRQGGSFLALLIAAILGGAIAAGGIVLLGRAGILDFAPPKPPGPDLAAEIGTLQSEIAALKQQAGDAPPLAPLQQQVAALEQAVGELRNQPPATTDTEALQQLQGRLSELEQLATGGDAGAANAALEARLADLSGQIEALKSTPATAPVSPETKAEIDALAGRVTALETRLPEALSGLEGSSAALRNDLTQLSARLDGLPTAERVDALETGLKTTSQQVAKVDALGPAVAANALADALQSGAPYAAELAALRGLGLDEATLSGLAPQADSGLPTLADLRSDFEAAAAKIDLRPAVAEGSGTLDRLLGSARGLVEVRPADPTEGSDPAAILSRIRGALAADDLKTALAEREALPEADRAATEDWARAAQARLTADELVARLRADALSRLGSEG